MASYVSSFVGNLEYIYIDAKPVPEQWEEGIDVASKSRANLYIWSARILAIAYALFQSLFGLDVFTGEAGLFQELLAFLIHIIPSLVIYLIVALFWRRPEICAYCFFAMSILFTLVFRTYYDVLLFAILTLPIALIGLFYLGAYLSKKQAGK